MHFWEHCCFYKINAHHFTMTNTAFHNGKKYGLHIGGDRGGHNVLDGCYADTAEIGYLIQSGTRMINCDFFNNKLMGMKNSTAIKHVKGNLSVVSCCFRGTVGSEVLYEGTSEDVEWISNIAVGGENMKDDFLRKNTINLN